MTIAQRLARARTRIARQRPSLSSTRVWQLARESLGLCVDCGRRCPKILAKRCRKHLDLDAARRRKRLEEA